MSRVPNGRTVVLVALWVVACASGSGTAERELIALEHRWVAALATDDRAALDDLLADDFRDTTASGAVHTKGDVLAGRRAGAGYRSIALEDLLVRVHGATAIVDGVNVLRAIDGGSVVRIRFTDVLLRRRGRWRAVAAQETLERTPAQPE